MGAGPAPGALTFDFFPLGSAGVNSTDDQSQLAEGQVRDAVNIIFERKIARTRPGLQPFSQPVSMPAPMPQITYAQAFNMEAVTTTLPPKILPFIILQDAGLNIAPPTLWMLLNPQFGPSQVQALTPSGISVAPVLRYTNNLPMVEYFGKILFGNVAGGFLEFDPNSTAPSPVTQITAVAPVFLTSYLGRVVAAFSLALPNSPSSARTVMWSAPGDETTWTGATSGAGNTVLGVSDYITGLVKLSNFLVICRSGGFHIATPTGQAFPAFNFQRWSEDSTGVTWPDTVACLDNVIYFVGPDNIYMCDLNSPPRAIGDDIVTEFMAAQMYGGTQGNTEIPVGQYQGYITRATAGFGPNRFKTYYNLFPIQVSTGYPGGGPGTLSSPALFHYKFSISDGTWSKHDYTNSMCPIVFEDTGDVAATLHATWPNAPSDAFIDVSDGANIIQRAWASSWGQPFVSAPPPPTCERPASITTRNHIMGNLNRNSRVQRVLLRTRDFGPQAIQVSLTSRYDGATVGGGAVVTIPAGVNNDGQWIRSWADVGRVLGQDFVLQINVPANGEFATDGYGFLWGDEGDFRG